MDSSCLISISSPRGTFERSCARHSLKSGDALQRISESSNYGGEMFLRFTDGLVMGQDWLSEAR